MDHSYMMLAPNVIGLSYVLSLMVLSYLLEIHNIIWVFLCSVLVMEIKL